MNIIGAVIGKAQKVLQEHPMPRVAVTVDGVDISVLGSSVTGHLAATATAGHGSVGAHDHQTAANGDLLDHGAALSGLGDDDHTQYLNNTRHDTTTRHTLGTVVPHDDHG